MSSLEPFRDRNLRIGDAERNALTEILRSSTDSGHISLSEYEKRVDTIMSATTVAEAEIVLMDLPAYHAILDSHDAKGKLGKTPAWIKWLWFGVSIPIGINVGVWAFVYALTGGNAQYFWPVWVVMPLLVVAGAVTIAERSILRPQFEEKRRQNRRRL
jgi:hypothetical protein